MARSESPEPRDTVPLTLRVKGSVRDDLDLMAEYKGSLGATDLARTWIVEGVNETKADRLYQLWLARNHPPKPREQAQLA